MIALWRALYFASVAGEHGRCEPVGGHLGRSAPEARPRLPVEVGFLSATPGAQSAQLPGTLNSEGTMLTHTQKVELARQRFGQPFVHERGSKWQPNQVPYLTRWLKSKGRD